MENLHESAAGELGASRWTGGAVGGCGACCFAVFVSPFSLFSFSISLIILSFPACLSPLPISTLILKPSPPQISSPPRSANNIHPLNRAQGAATALEDAYILGKLFANPPLSSSPIPTPQKTDIPTLLHRYCALRKPRADRLTAASATTRDFDHLADGPAQVARDEGLRGMRLRRAGHVRDVGLKEVEVEMGMGKDGGGQGWGDCWLDEGFQAWLFGAGLETGPGEGVDGVVGGPSRD